jgi:hypothetical protein
MPLKNKIVNPDGTWKLHNIAIVGVASVVAIVAGWHIFRSSSEQDTNPDANNVQTAGAQTERVMSEQQPSVTV